MRAASGAGGPTTGVDVLPSFVALLNASNYTLWRSGRPRGPTSRRPAGGSVEDYDRRSKAPSVIRARYRIAAVGVTEAPSASSFEC